MHQTSLFTRTACPAATLALPLIPGLACVTDVIDEAEERALLAAIDAMPWRRDFRRRTQHYGVSYAAGAPASRGRGEPLAAPPFPDFLLPLAGRARDRGWISRFPENAVLNEYLPGQGIGAHHDLPAFGPTVCAFSLGAPCVMDFTDPETGAKHAFDLAPRSVLVLGGEARSRWMHGIAGRKSDVIGGERRGRGRRVSVTFRTLA